LLTLPSACTAAIVKTVLQSKIFTDPDFTFHDSFSVWNNVELHVGIIAACLPALRPLFSALLDGAKALTTRRPGSSTARQHPYYIQDDSTGRGIKLGSLPGNGGLGSQPRKYDVTVTTRLQSGMRSSSLGSKVKSESEEDLKQKASDELFIMRERNETMKGVNVRVHH
jgi:hypothetical protein